MDWGLHAIRRRLLDRRHQSAFFKTLLYSSCGPSPGGRQKNPTNIGKKLRNEIMQPESSMDPALPNGYKSVGLLKILFGSILLLQDSDNMEVFGEFPDSRNPTEQNICLCCYGVLDVGKLYQTEAL